MGKIDESEIVIKAKDLTAQVFADVSKRLQAVNADARTTSLGFGQLASAFSAASLVDKAVGAIASWTSEAIASAGAITDLANKTGLSIDTIQRMQYVAKQSGSDMRQFADAAFKLGTNIAGGNGSVRAAAQQLGLQWEQLRAMTPDEQFNAVTTAIEGMQNPQARNTAALALFGKTAKDVIPAIVDGYQKMAHQATVSSDGQVRAVDAASDALDRFETRAKTTITSVLGSAVMAAEEAKSRGILGWMALVNPLTAASDLVPARAAAAEKAAAAAAQVHKDPVAAPLAPSYVDSLKEAEAGFRKLTAAQRANIEAAIKLGTSNDDIVNGLHITDDVLTVAKKAFEDQKAAVSKATAAGEKYAALLADILAASVPLTVEQRAQIVALDKLGISTSKMAEFMGIAEAPISRFNDALKEQAKTLAEVGKNLDRIPHNVQLRLSTENLSGAVPMIDVAAVQAASSSVKTIADATFSDIEGRMKAHGVLTTAELDKLAAAATADYENMRASGKFTALEVQTAFVAANRAIAAANGETADGFQALAQQFQQLAQIAGNSFGSILQTAGGIISALGTAKQANIDFAGHAGIANAMFSDQATSSQKWASAIASGGAIASGAMAVWSATANDGTKAAGAFHGAMSGAKAGAVFGPYGMAVGAAAGAIAGMIHALTAGRRAVEDFAKSFDTIAPGDGFEELHAKLQTALGDVGEHFWVELTQRIKRGDKKGADALIAEIQGALANAPNALAAAAGYQTKAELQTVADKAKQVYDYMVSSGQYTAATIADAFTKMQEAQTTALGEEAAAASAAMQKAHDDAKAVVDGLDQQLKSLQDSIASEAPEEVMGIVEAHTRAQIAAVTAQRKDAQDALDQVNQQIQDAADAALAATQKVAEGAGKAAVSSIQQALDDANFRIRFHADGDGSGSPMPSHAQGAYIRESHVARVHKGEVIGDADFMTTALTRALRNVGHSAAGGGRDQTIVLQMDGRQMAQVLVRHLPGEVARHTGFRGR